MPKMTIHVEGDGELIHAIRKFAMEVSNMAKTVQEFLALLPPLRQAIKDDVEQDKVVVTTVTALLEAIKNLPNAKDFQAEFDDVSAAIGELTGDNAAVQAALDAAAAAAPPA